MGVRARSRAAPRCDAPHATTKRSRAPGSAIVVAIRADVTRRPVGSVSNRGDLGVGNSRTFFDAALSAGPHRGDVGVPLASTMQANESQV